MAIIDWNGLTAPYSFVNVCPTTGTPVAEFADGKFHFETSFGANYAGVYYYNVPTIAGETYSLEVEYSYLNSNGTGVSIQFYNPNDQWSAPNSADIYDENGGLISTDGKIPFEHTAGSFVTKKYHVTPAYTNIIMRMRITYGSCYLPSGDPVTCSGGNGCSGGNYSNAYSSNQIVYVRALSIRNGYGLVIRDKNNDVTLNITDKITRFIGGWYNQNKNLGCGPGNDPPPTPSTSTSEWYSNAEWAFYDPKEFDPDWTTDNGGFVVVATNPGSTNGVFPPTAIAYAVEGEHQNKIKLTRQTNEAWRCNFDLLAFRYK